MTLGNSYLVTEDNLNALRQWFIRYVQSFDSGDPIVSQAVTLKKDHSLRVCDEILNIGKRLDLSPEHLRLAEAIALLHDVGRFEQVKRYRTFVDMKSEDHGELGVKVLHAEKALALLNEATQELILKAVAYHNRMAVPEDESPMCIYFTSLLRDADKLDIFNLVTDFYCAPPEERNSTVELDLPDTPLVSEDVLDGLRNRKMIKLNQLQSLNDFKLLQMAWIYDINYQPAFQMIQERRYLERIRNTMPASETIDRIYERLSLDLQQRAESRVTLKSPSF